ncbi:MAG: hypothetical protein ABIP17_16105 [Ilumatobacteraceae bacterium]
MRRSETIVRSDLRRGPLPADRVVAARAVGGRVVAGPTPLTVVPICLVAGIAAALLSADLAWSHRAGVAATVAFGLAIALWHARPGRTAWWLTGALATVVAVVGSRVDVLDGADPAWLLWATALAVVVSCERPLNASTDGGDDPNVMMTAVSVLAASTAVFSAWWYIAGPSLFMAATIGAVPVAAVLFVAARAGRSGSSSMTAVAMTSGVIGTALALVDPVPHIGQAAIAAVITGLVGVTMSTVGSPLVNRLVEMLVLTALVTAAGSSTWTLVAALAIGAFVVLRIGTPTVTVAAHDRSLTARSADPSDLTVATERSARRGMPTFTPVVIENEAVAEEAAEGPVPDRSGPDDRPGRRRFEWPGPDSVEVSRPAHVPDAPSTSSPESETVSFAFDLWSALGIDQVDGASEPDRAAQSVFSQHSKTSVFDEPEATPRSSS